MRSPDTSPEAYRIQIEVFRKMDPGRRVELALQLSDDVLALMADGIRDRHPDYNEESVQWALQRVRHGDDLFRKVWPHAPLLTP